ncbi:MAG: DNA-directed RNA polymerase subunit alpha [Candidatus Cloacimonetes bacterium]|nr:DNA-directed RNA polymerase subunit alpha [Candidatus Cloacimonadota bacterium]
MFLEPLQMPENVATEESTYSRNYGKFEIGPLEPGFGTTVGNTLRRVLLSSIQGAAVRHVRIEGLHHEFAPIPGTNSDYIDLILRLKQLVVQCNVIDEVKVELEHKGKGVVTAAEIRETADVRIINKDLYLLEVTENTDLKIELWIGIGRGYVPADKQISEGKPVGAIPIDSIYSPILKVNFSVTHQRVKEKMNYDKLILEIWSNGAYEPKHALFLSAKIIKDMFGKLCLFEVEPEYIKDVQLDPELEELERILKMSVKEIELTVRAANCLDQANIYTIGELVGKSEAEMLKFRNFGKKSLEEIVQKLKKYELTLGMDIDSIYQRINDARSRGIPVAKPEPVKHEPVAATVKEPKQARAVSTPPKKPIPGATKKKVK